MTMVWQDFSHLNKKYADAWLSGLGDAGVFDTGNVLTPKRGGMGLGALSFAQVQTLQDLLNLENDYRDRPYIQVTGTWNNETCLTVMYFVSLLQQGEQVDPFLYDFLYNNENDIAAACTALSQQPPPGPGPAPAPSPPAPGPGPAPAPSPNEDTTMPSNVSACNESGCDCYVNEGDQGPHLTSLQAELNAALDQAGYDPIPQSGVYDKETCGAIFELQGSFVPTYPPSCTNVEGEWIVPLQCPDMVRPTKKGGGTSRASMFAIGGLLLAAGLGGAYWLSKR